MGAEKEEEVRDCNESLDGKESAILSMQCLFSQLLVCFDRNHRGCQLLQE